MRDSVSPSSNQHAATILVIPSVSLQFAVGSGVPLEGFITDPKLGILGTGTRRPVLSDTRQENTRLHDRSSVRGGETSSRRFRDSQHEAAAQAQAQQVG